MSRSTSVRYLRSSVSLSFFAILDLSLFAARAMDSTPAIRDHLCGDQFKCNDDQRGDDDHIIEMADDRDKVGDEIEGQQGVSDG